MKIGLQLHPDRGVDAVIAEARLADEQGFDSVWLSDHIMNTRGEHKPDGPLDLFTLAVAIGAVTTRTRLAWGLVYQLRPLGDAEKAQHLRAEAERRGLKLGDDVVGFLLTRFPRDLPSLRGALEVLDRYSLIKQRALTLPLVREALAAAQQSAELPRQRGGR